MALKRIQDLDPATTPLDGSELVELQQGADSVQCTTQDIADLGGGGGSETDTIITEGSAFTATPATHAGRSRYIRAGGDVEFDVAEGYSTGEIYKIRATGAIQLVGTGVTLTPPYGGSLDLEADMAVQIVMTSSSAGDVIGQTVPA